MEFCSFKSKSRLESFEDIVKRHREKNLSSMIENYSAKNNRTIILRELLHSAYEKKQPVRIIDDTFNQNLANDIGGCMDNGCIVKAIGLGSKVDFNNKFINAITRHENGYFKQDTKTDLNLIIPLHFMLVGDKSYCFRPARFRQSKAIANFNNKQFGKSLEEHFDGIYEAIQSAS